jgi:hypothetical protein
MDDQRGGGFDKRHLARVNAERSDPTAPQTYGYLSELFSSPRHADLDPGLRFGQLQALLLHYLALAEDGALPTGRGIAAWKLVPKPPYCDADGRPRSLPEPIVHTAASGGMGTPVASRRHVGETPAVKLVPANMQAAARMPPAAVARRRFYDEAVAFVEQLLRQTGASGCSRLRAELQYLGSAAAVVMSKQHARLAIDGNYDAWADLAREVLSSKFLYDELGS